MLVLAGAASGSTSAGTVPSAFKTRKLDKPPLITVPFASVSFTLTVMLAVGLLDNANTVRVAPECAAMVTSTLVVAGDGGVTDGTEGLLIPAVKDAKPPAGWLAIESWKYF
jgi:hypothetical protein